VRIEIKKKYNDPQKNFKEMLKEFNRRVSNAGLIHAYKEHRFFETKSEKRRRKKKETEKHFATEALVDKILAGERVKAPSGLVKKVLNSHKKEKKTEAENTN